MFFTEFQCWETIPLQFVLKSDISHSDLLTFLSCVMPSGFIRSIFPRRLRCQHVEETVTGQAAGRAPEKATSCVLQDPPPPYAFDNHAKDGDRELPSESSSIRPTTTEISTQPDSKLLPSVSVRSCPHGTSSFERIQRIVRLQNFKESYEGLDALIPGPAHRDPFTLKFRLCKPDSGSNLDISELNFSSHLLLNHTALGIARPFSGA